MIYTVTLNPALDYVVRAEHFTVGTINRLKEEHIFVGGKGINVSLILSELGIESIALGFIAGFTGKALIEGLQQKDVRSEMITVREGMTRINMKLRAEEETEINGIGPLIRESDLLCLLERIKTLQEGDVLVISGSVPGSLKNDVYERIVSAMPEGVLLAADAEKDLLLPLLKYRPFIIKPNHIELAAMCETVIENEEQLAACARQLQEKGARNVLVSMGGDGAILLDEEKKISRMPAVKGEILSTVGCGDSMLAGFLAGWLKMGSYQEALRLGTACGAATAFRNGLGKRSDIDAILEKLDENKSSY